VGSRRAAGRVGKLDPQPLMNVFIEAFEQLAPRIIQTGTDALIHLLLEPLKSRLDFLRRPAFLIDGEDTLLEIETRFDATQDIIRRTKDTAEQAELLSQQLEHATICVVSLVQEIDYDNIVLLAVTMAPPDALFDALRVPRQVIIDDERAKLKVHSFRGCLRREKDRCLVAKMLNQCGTNIDRPRPRRSSRAYVPCQPAFINPRGLVAAVGPIEHNNLAFVAMRFEESVQVILRSARLSKHEGLSRRACFRHLGKANVERFQKGLGFCVNRNATRARRQLPQKLDFLLQLLAIDYRGTIFTILRGKVVRQNVIEQFVFDIFRFDQSLGKRGVI
jgi:hypothetical protein